MTNFIFQKVTMDNWSNVTREMVDARPWAFVLINVYVSFTGFVVLNLMIAVVCESLSDLKESSGDEVNRQEVYSGANVEEDATGFAEGCYDRPAANKTEATHGTVANLSRPMISPPDSTMAHMYDGQQQRSQMTISDEVKKTQAEIREILQAIMEKLPQT
jgi:hypothetical protein